MKDITVVIVDDNRDIRSALEAIISMSDGYKCVAILANAEDAIREIELQFNEAWGRHDADGMVASLADDAQFITVNGAWTKNSR